MVRIGSDSKTVPKVLDKLAEKWERGFVTRTIQVLKAHKAIACAEAIMKSQFPLNSISVESFQEVWIRRNEESRRNEEMYMELINHLVEYVNERVTKPKSFHFALYLLGAFSKFI